MLGALLAAPLTAMMPSGVSGQAWDNPILPKGHLELAGASRFTSWSYQYGTTFPDGPFGDEPSPLGWNLTDDALGTRLFPGEQALRDVLGEDAFRLDLGVGETVTEAGIIRLPLRAALGVTDWLTVGVNVPFVRRLLQVSQGSSADSTTAALAPMLTNAGGVDLFLGEFQTAVGSGGLAANELCASLGESDPACVAARGTVQDADAMFRALAGMYLGSPVFVLEGTADAATLVSRVDEIRTALGALGISDFTAPLPLGVSPMGEFFRSRMLMEPVSGMAVLHGQGWINQYALGDIELTADFQLLNLRTPVEEPGQDPRFSLQLAAGALFRLGTAVADAPETLVDLGSVRGQTDLELRAYGDVAYGGWIGLTGDVRYGMRGTGTGTLGWSETGQVLNLPAAFAPIEWEPGNYWTLKLSPRLRLTRGMYFFGQVRMLDRKEDVFRFQSATAPVVEEGEEYPLPDLSFLGAGTAGTQTVWGGGLSYSTLPAYQAGETGLPLMVRGGFETATSGTGGRMPKTRRFTAELRIFWQIWGD